MQALSKARPIMTINMLRSQADQFWQLYVQFHACHLRPLQQDLEGLRPSSYLSSRERFVH